MKNFDYIIKIGHTIGFIEKDIYEYRIKLYKDAIEVIKSIELNILEIKNFKSISIMNKNADKLYKLNKAQVKDLNKYSKIMGIGNDDLNKNEVVDDKKNEKEKFTKPINKQKKLIREYLKKNIEEINRINNRINKYNIFIKDANYLIILSPIDNRNNNIKKLFSDLLKNTITSGINLDKFDLFIYKLRDELENATKNSISIINKTFELRDEKIKSFNLKEFPTKYIKIIQEVLDLYLLGFKAQAHFTLGRIFEDISYNLLKSLILNKKIKESLEKLDSMNLESLINKLHSEKIINEKEFYILKIFRYDRNKYGHKINIAVENEISKTTEESIRLSLPYIISLNNKILK